ncbi:MAG: hypothetical protein Q7K36_00420 [Fusobacterium sp. JB020]|nr:hypothetical protein [Fusobacterium sp. JB020]
MKVKSIVVAHRAQMNKQLGGAVDILGSFDNMIQPIFPVPMDHMSIILTIEEILKPTLFEIRINGVDDDLITKGEFRPMIDPFGVGKKIFDLDKFIIPKRGRYTIELFEKLGEDKVKFISEHTLFVADYPPQREITPDQVKKILESDDLIKVVKTEFQPFGLDHTIKVQHSLDENIPLAEGYVAIPEENKIVVDGKEIDLLGLRRHLEWMFGNPVPKNNEEEPKKNEKKDK